MNVDSRIAGMERASEPPETVIDTAVADARACEARRDWQSAHDAWSRLLDTMPRSADVRSGLARSLAGLDRPQESRARFAALLQERPDHLETLVGYTSWLARWGSVEEAETLWRHSVAVRPHDPEWLTAQAVFLRQEGRPGAAEAALRALAACEAPDAVAVSAARVACDACDASDIVEPLRRILAAGSMDAIDRDRLALLGLHAVALATVGRATEALACVKEIETRLPAGPGTLPTRVDVLWRLRRRDDAARLIEEALREAGDRHRPWAAAIEAWMRIGQPGAATAVLGRAALEGPEDLWVELAADLADHAGGKGVSPGPDTPAIAAKPDAATLCHAIESALHAGETTGALTMAAAASALIPHDPGLRSAAVASALAAALFVRFGVEASQTGFPDARLELIARYLAEHPRAAFAAGDDIVFVVPALDAAAATDLGEVLLQMARLAEDRWRLLVHCPDIAAASGSGLAVAQLRREGIEFLDPTTPVFGKARAKVTEVERRIVALFPRAEQDRLVRLRDVLLRLRPRAVLIWRAAEHPIAAAGAVLAGSPRIVVGGGASGAPSTALLALPGVIVLDEANLGMQPARTAARLVDALTQQPTVSATASWPAAFSMSAPMRPAPAAAEPDRGVARDDAEPIDALLSLGRRHVDAGQLEAAREVFAEASRRAPDDPEPLRWLGRCLRTAGDNVAALRVWRRLQSLDPADDKAALRCLEALVALGRTSDASALGERLFGQGHRDPALFRLFARALAGEGRFAEALTAWNHLLDAVPADFEALFRSGEAALKAGQEALAEDRLRAAAAQGGVDLRPLLLLVHRLVWAGRQREARRLVRAALAAQPAQLELWQCVFEFVRVTARPGLADRVLMRLSRYFDRDGVSRLFFARLLVADGRVATADRLLVQLEAESSEPLPFAAERGMLALGRGDLAGAGAVRARLTAKPPAPGAPADTRFLPAHDACRDFLRRYGAPLAASWTDVFVGAVDQFRRRNRRPAYSYRPGVVLHVLNSLAPGGTERQCALVASRQAERAGHRDQIFVLRTDPSVIGRGVFFLPHLEAAGVASTTLAPYQVRAEGLLREMAPLHEPPSPLRGIVAVRQIAAILAAIESIRPELVQAWTPQCCASAAFAGLLAGTPRIVLRGGSVAPGARLLTSEVERERNATLKALLGYAAVQPAVTLVNNTQANLDGWLHWLGLRAGEVGGGVGVVPNVVEPAAFDPPDALAVTQLRERLGLPAGGTVVGAVMRLEREKDPELWVAVVEAVSRRHPDAFFVLVGDGRLRRRVEASLARRSLAGRVVLTGNVSGGLAAYYGLFDVLVLTSRFEGLPNVLLEAQAQGVPVVAPAVGGVAEAMLAGDTGLLVRDRSPAALADAIGRLLADTPLRARMSVAARRFVARVDAQATRAILALADGTFPATAAPVAAASPVAPEMALPWE